MGVTSGALSFSATVVFLTISFATILLSTEVEADTTFRANNVEGAKPGTYFPLANELDMNKLESMILDLRLDSMHINQQPVYLSKETNEHTAQDVNANLARVDRNAHDNSHIVMDFTKHLVKQRSRRQNHGDPLNLGIFENSAQGSSSSRGAYRKFNSGPDGAGAPNIHPYDKRTSAYGEIRPPPINIERQHSFSRQ
eukprot:CFRG0628T1